MKIDKNSIVFKIIIPIFIFTIIITLLLLIVANKLTTKILDDYHALNLSIHATEIQKILETAVSELTITQLLDQEVVTENQKKITAEEIALYWKNNDLMGMIITTDGNIINSSIPDALKQEVLHVSGIGYFHLEKALDNIQGYIIDFPIWNWRVITLSEGSNLSIYESTVSFILPLMVVGFLVVLAGVLTILNTNLRTPIKKIASYIQSGEKIKYTGITELDYITNTINEAFEKVNKKTEQFQALYSIAVSFHQNISDNEMLNLIVNKSSQMLGAELAAMALYDDHGKFKKFITSGVTIDKIEALPKGEGLLEFLRLSVTPVRINNLLEHPSFSGSFPKGHPVVKNILSYPIFSEEGIPKGILFFGNKDGGFTEDDEVMLKAISADTAMILSKIENLMLLKNFKKLIDSAFDVIVITDRDGYITYVNNAFETVTGYSKKEAIGKKMNILKSGYHDTEFYKKLWDTIINGDIWKGEFINKTKNGEIYYASSVIFPFYADGECKYVSIQRDISQEKKLYEQLLRAQKMEAIGTLAGGIAHDFNNILTAVLGYSDILLTMIKEGDPIYKPVKIINDAAQRGADLAKKILLVSRKEKLEMRPVNINEVIKNSIELIQRSIPKNIDIIMNLKDNIPYVMADPSQLHQVIMNLAVNARDAMPEGGSLIIESSLVGSEDGAANGVATDKEGFIKLSISDTGTGISKELQSRIFDPFFTTKEAGKGTGLGLYIVHSIINNHGGYVNLYSEYGKGTRFNIYLPTMKTSQIEHTFESEDFKGTGTILVIDDEADIRELSMDMLSPLGYNILLAKNGSDGLSIFREKKDEISLVILDMIMPKMSGNEVFHALKTIKEDVKVLLCSGYSHSGFAGIDKLLKEGAAGFVQKPFTRQTIANAIKEALSK